MKTSITQLARKRAVGMLRGMAVTAVIFDRYETLITQFDPNWEPPKVSVAERMGIEEEVFRRNWTSLGVTWRKGCHERFEALLGGGMRVRRPPGTRRMAGPDPPFPRLPATTDLLNWL